MKVLIHTIKEFIDKNKEYCECAKDPITKLDLCKYFYGEIIIDDKEDENYYKRFGSIKHVSYLTTLDYNPLIEGKNTNLYNSLKDYFKTINDYINNNNIDNIDINNNNLALLGGALEEHQYLNSYLLILINIYIKFK